MTPVYGKRDLDFTNYMAPGIMLRQVESVYGRITCLNCCSAISVLNLHLSINIEYLNFLFTNLCQSPKTRRILEVTLTLSTAFCQHFLQSLHTNLIRTFRTSLAGKCSRLSTVLTNCWTTIWSPST